MIWYVIRGRLPNGRESEVIVTQGAFDEYRDELAQLVQRGESTNDPNDDKEVAKGFFPCGSSEERVVGQVQIVDNDSLLRHDSYKAGTL